MKFNDDFYVEWIPEALDFIQYIRNHSPEIKPGKAEEIIEDVMGYIQIDADKDFIFNELKLHGIAPLNNKQELEFEELYKKLELSTRSWHTNGFQLRDFQEIEKKYGPIPEVMETFKKHELVKTIGRNDPCPCGSGKKYKKFCMSKNKELIYTKGDE